MKHWVTSADILTCVTEIGKGGGNSTCVPRYSNSRPPGSEKVEGTPVAGSKWYASCGVASFSGTWISAVVFWTFSASWESIKPKKFRRCAAIWQCKMTIMIVDQVLTDMTIVTVAVWQTEWQNHVNVNHEVNAKLSHNVQDQVRQTTNAPVNSIFVKRIQFLYFIRAYRYILETVDNQVTNSTSPDHTTIIKHHITSH